MLRDYLERRRIKKIFGRVLTPAAVQSLLSGDKFEASLTEGPLQFAFPYVRGTPSEISARAGTVAAVAKTHCGVFYTALGPLCAVAWGRLAWSPPDMAKRLAFVEDLRRQLRGDVKIIHGAAIGHHGLLGTEATVFNYSFIIPHFDKVLAALARLEFGAEEEFKE